MDDPKTGMNVTDDLLVEASASTVRITRRADSGHALLEVYFSVEEWFKVVRGVEDVREYERRELWRE